ncbi:cell division cycle-associated protein 7-like [Xyrichtys novacula]|uniref:Cell division cycle-associated protein 7-like n=1 Tax=Xyrichtys novacula TaxID=13765 RepID=A0AAV1ENT8_XYRNO|nr:cell division cycle-associated protein 7-like [Xyrichtys novacula]
MPSVKKKLAVADVFAGDSEDDQTFYGFSDGELDDNSNLEDESESQPEVSPKRRKTTSKPSSRAQPFKLKVALRSTRSTRQSTDEEEEESEEEVRSLKRGMKRAGHAVHAKRRRQVKFKLEDDDETELPQSSPSKDPGSDPEEDEAESFLAKRKQNIEANKAMLAQLMADLQKMPGGAGLLKTQSNKKKTKEKSSRPPRSGGESRRNPERASRRLTRSMGGVEDLVVPKEEEELELSLEDELLKVHRSPQRRSAPRPYRGKSHVIRPVEDITEDELQLVSENMTDKVYNRVTGSTCHQCRQKTIDTKTCCRSEDCQGIRGQFCGPCLRNRYGEDVRKALLDPEWKCPPCRGICNCSFCRLREGRCPTGILFPLAQYHGFSDVHSYLSSLRNKVKGEVDAEM